MPAELTLAEQAGLTVGATAWTTKAVERRGVRTVVLADGPHGLRKTVDGNEASLTDSVPATCFPTAVTLGSTWNRALLREVGVALGDEAASLGVDVLLGPGVNLKRSPLGGRNFEYFSEDPVLTAELATSYIEGVQSTGVGASIKHFVANDVENRRYGIDVLVDDRALRELYLTAFEKPIRQGRPATVMAAYSKLDGTHCTENRWLLTDLLRGEWGYQGVVVSDWGACWDRTLSVPAGLDLEMPGPGDGRALADAVRDGIVPSDAVARASARIVTLAQRTAPSGVPYDAQAHHELAARAAAEGMVLLRNDGILPLDADASVALVGAFADEPRYQGAGSSHVLPTRLSNLRAALVARSAGRVTYRAGCDRAGVGVDPGLIADAVEAARLSDVAVVVVGLPESFESEGVDREHLRLPPGHEALVRAVAAANPRTVVVLQNGSPVELPWRAEVAAIVEAHLGGQAGGDALADVLVGLREPSGRLAETFPERLADHPAAQVEWTPTHLEYWESLFVGYRYFDSAGVGVAYPFGHGLSYTTFSWSDVRLEPGEGWPRRVSVTVTNTGRRRGSEVVQVYVHRAGRVERPEQELRAFEKVEVDAGASAVVTLELDRRAFAHWDVASGGWVVEGGVWQVRAAASSRDVRSTVSVEVPGDAVATVGVRVLVAGEPFTRDRFAAVYGRPLPVRGATAGAPYTLDTALVDMDSPVARGLRKVVGRAATKVLGGGQGDDGQSKVVDSVVGQLTMRMLGTVSNGAINRGQAKVLLRAINLARRRRRRSRS